MQADKPLDARLARRLVYPLRQSPLRPNHLTTLRLLSGICACILFSQGGYVWSNAGALCFVISNLLDHADGELARLSGHTSKAGHYYDLACDLIVNALLFVGIGLGVSRSGAAVYALPLGLLAGVAVAAIFHLRLLLEQQPGKTDNRQPHVGVFEAEDVLYLLPLVTLSGQLHLLLLLAGLGAPLFALWVLRAYLAARKSASVQADDTA